MICAKVGGMPSALQRNRPVVTARPSELERGPDKGELAREQLLAHATRIFAAKGFAATTTREICDAAGKNIAALAVVYDSALA